MRFCAASNGSDGAPLGNIYDQASRPVMLSITLLGRFSARVGDQSIPLLDGSKAQELFVYLLLKRHQAHTREEIACVLWQDSTPVRSKANLRKALWQLNAALHSRTRRKTPATPVLQIDGDWLRVHPEAPVWLDVAVLESAHTDTRGLDGASLPPRMATALNKAVALYTGDLLPNRYQGWCLEERERVKHLYLCLLEKLLDFSEGQGKYEAGLSYALEMLTYDPTREHIHRQIMRLHCLHGDRASALRQYGQCVEVLATELGVAPMRETTELYERIREGDGNLALPVGSGGAQESSLQDLVQRLDQLQGVLGALRRSVEHAVSLRESPDG
jgi:DNA-binding SARP family transcriptional activator